MVPKRPFWAVDRHTLDMQVQNKVVTNLLSSTKSGIYNVSYFGLFQKTPKQEVDDNEFPGVLKKYQLRNSEGLIKNIVEFVEVIKQKSCGISWVLVLGLKISQGCNKNLWSFQGSSFVLSEIPRGKVKNLKFPWVWRQG